MQQVIPAVSKVLTKTMIEKGNPDCFKELAALARLFGVNFDTLPNGEKKELPLVFTDGTKTVIRFYRVNGKGGRQDRRYNIPAAVLREQASVGDTIAFSDCWSSRWSWSSTLMLWRRSSTSPVSLSSRTYVQAVYVG